jgi:hypothetical protein
MRLTSNAVKALLAVLATAQPSCRHPAADGTTGAAAPFSADVRRYPRDGDSAPEPDRADIRVVRLLATAIANGSTAERVASELGGSLTAADAPRFWRVTRPTSAQVVLLEAERPTDPVVGGELVYADGVGPRLRELFTLWGQPATQRSARLASAGFRVGGSRVRAVAHLSTQRVVLEAMVTRLVFYTERRD